MDTAQLLNLVTDIGCELLENGAETYRVEDTMQRVFHAYGYTDADVFVIPNCMTISITPSHKHSIAKTRRIRCRRTDLNRVDRINGLCREICQRPDPPEEVYERLRAIQNEQRYSPLMRTAGAALVGFGFTLFYGGTLADALCAALIAAITQFLANGLEQLGSNGIFVNIIGGGLIMLMSLFFTQFQFNSLHLDKIVIGALMILVPGLALTNSMRDLIAGDYVSGQARLAEALLTATAIALGAGVVLSLAR